MSGISAKWNAFRKQLKNLLACQTIKLAFRKFECAINRRKLKNKKPT